MTEIASEDSKWLKTASKSTKQVQIHPNTYKYFKYVQMDLNQSKLVQVGPSQPNRSKEVKKNQDQLGYGLSLWFWLYGICMEKKYRYKLPLSIFLYLQMLLILKKMFLVQYASFYALSWIKKCWLIHCLCKRIKVHSVRNSVKGQINHLFKAPQIISSSVSHSLSVNQ